ncbi:hypothetical protein M8C17_01215 [Micromonospora sp. RHAY321]|uniref:hypothetical protein n=1 Tax=Micromonospora sp. RHAY321 TaxID=2944807 RepID=UPI00207CD952|nr:hypothetical protein [Micromonospora sp. RHAY321]MCO1593781.1 hypothetical protein [Micromonospora sp. RHAY321]
MDVEAVRIEGHPLRIEAVRAHLADAGKAWQDLSEEQRQEYVLSLLAPCAPAGAACRAGSDGNAGDSNSAGRADAATDE